VCCTAPGGGPMICPKNRKSELNPRPIVGGQNPKANPNHRLQQRRGSVAPLAGSHLRLCHPERSSRRIPYPRAVRRPRREFPPALPTASGALPETASAVPVARGPSTSLSLASRPTTPLRMTEQLGLTNSAQNKTPQTRSSRGTYVDQPSPKCCSITRLNGSRTLVNG
jgi:hypothetical protein